MTGKRKRTHPWLAFHVGNKEIKRFWCPQASAISKHIWLPKTNASKQTNSRSWYSQTRHESTDPCSSGEWRLAVQSKLECAQNSRPRKAPKLNCIVSEGNFEKTETKLKGIDAMAKKQGAIIRTVSYRLYPNGREKHRLRCWGGTNRFVYNQGLKYMESRQIQKGKWKEAWKACRVFLHRQLPLKHPWMLEIPYSIRDDAFRELKKNYSANFNKLKRLKADGETGKFEMKPKRRRNGVTFPIQKGKIRTKGEAVFLYRGRSKWEKTHWNLRLTDMLKRPKQRREQRPPKVTHRDAEGKVVMGMPPILSDIKISIRYGRYFVHIPRLCMPHKESQAPHEVAGFDPGVRNFLTSYGPNGEWSIHGSDAGSRQKLIRLGQTLDHTVSRHAKLVARMKTLGKNTHIPKCKKRKGTAPTLPIKLVVTRYRRKMQTLRRKFKNKVRELHAKVALAICRRYKTVLIPFAFGNESMVKKGERNIHGQTVRQLLSWSHGRFRRYLKCKAEEFGTRIVDVGEAFTSRTCTQCGADNAVNGDTYRCTSCSLVLDRDCNGARNIFVRWLTTA